MDRKFILSKYDISSTRYIEAEDSVEVKQVLLFLPVISCFFSCWYVLHFTVYFML